MRNDSPATETEAIDAFLDNVMEEIAHPPVSLARVARHIASMTDAHLSARPNHAAFREIAGQIQAAAQRSSRAKSPKALQDAMSTITTERARLSTVFWDLGSTIVPTPRRLLVYSHSVRVTQALLGVDPEVQASCALYIAECRPKSPSAFKDALRTAESLADARYRPALIPDAMCFGLVTDHEVDMVLLGAHAVFLADRWPIAFVNTVGTETLVRLAQFADSPVDVFVLAESAKIVDVSGRSGRLPEISRGSEIPVSWQPPANSPMPPGTTFLNLGYEQCRFLPNTRLITESSYEADA